MGGTPPINTQLYQNFMEMYLLFVVVANKDHEKTKKLRPTGRAGGAPPLGGGGG